MEGPHPERARFAAGRARSAAGVRPAPDDRGGPGAAPQASHQEDHALASATDKKLRPLSDRVVVQPTPREEITKTGIVLPDTAKEKPQEGVILAVGPGLILEDGTRGKMDLVVGDKVLYAKYAGTEFKVDGQDLLIISQKDILAVVEV